MVEVSASVTGWVTRAGIKDYSVGGTSRDADPTRLDQRTRVYLRISTLPDIYEVYRARELVLFHSFVVQGGRQFRPRPVPFAIPFV